jgi:DNA invertase Pin-like site-specific DNA recombinase
MADARKGVFQCVAVWKFDRFGRSLRNLLTALEEFKRLKIDFVSATEGIDTTTPGGELAFQIFGAMAQWERSLLSDRVKSGLGEALRKGKKLGRPPIKRLTPAEVRHVQADRGTGKFTLRALAAKYGTSVWAMQQATSGQNKGYEN